MITPAANAASPMLYKPADPFEWALAAALCPIVLAAPVALVIFLWPVMTGAFGVFLFCLALALGFIISAFFLWLFAPVLVLTGVLAAVLLSAVRGLWRMARKA